MTETPTVTLRKPIVQGPQRFTVLSFREPTGGDLCESGYPFKLSRGSDGETVRLFDAPAITQLISRLASVPLSAAKALGVLDWNDCMDTVAGFFAEAEDATYSTDTPAS